MKLIMLLILMVVLVAPVSSRATEYFVATDGDDGYAGTNIAMPFVTIEKAVEMVVPGDTVFIRGGSYTSKLSVANLRASEVAPIVFQNYSGETVQITPGSWDWSTAFTIEDSSYIFLQGLNFGNCEGSRHPVEVVSSVYCEITDCVFSNTPYPPALEISSSTNITISGCIFTDTGTAGRDWDSHLIIGPADAACENISVRNCDFFESAGNDLVDHAIEMMRANNSEIAGCDFHDFDNANVVTLGIPSWYYTPGESLPHSMLVVSNRFYDNNCRAFKFQMCHNSELKQNSFLSNKCDVAHFGEEASYCNAMIGNLFVDNFDLLSENDAFIITVQDAGISNYIIGNEIYNTYIPETISSNSPEAIFVQNTSYLNIISNHIHDIRVKANVDLTYEDPSWYIPGTNGGYAAFGMHILGTSAEITNIVIIGNTVSYVRTGISVGGARYAVMNSNLVHHCGTYGTRFKNGTRDSWMEGNEIYECGALHGGCSGIGLGFSGKSNVIYRNYVHHCHQGTAGKIGTNWWGDGNGMIADMDSDDTFFISNLSAFNEGRGLAITASERTRVFNNTFVGNGKCPQYQDMPGLGIYSKISEGYPATSNVIVNNIFYDNVYREISVDDIRGQVIHHNLFFSNSLSTYEKPIFWNDTNISYSARSMTVQEWKDYSATYHPENAIGALWVMPEFINSGGGNYRLDNISPAIDAGENTLMSRSDLDGIPRPLDGNDDGTNTVDVGCYEFINADADSDGDSMPDRWEVDYNLDPTNARDALIDTDGDGPDNKDEYIADTDPTSRLSYFHITAISNNSPVSVYFLSSSNRLYTMDGCSNLVIGIWSNIPGAGARMGVGGLDSMGDTNEPTKGPFYRLGAEVPND